MDIAKKPATQERLHVAPHVKLFNDVKTRLKVEGQVMFDESGRAFLAAAERVAEPESRQFVDDVMVGTVEIFLNQFAENVSQPILIHFDHVLTSSAKIISWELRTLRCIKRLKLLGKILDETAQFYQDEETLVNGTRRPGVVRLAIIKDLIKDGTFALLLQMLRGQVPILEWSPADYTPPAGAPAPESAPLTVRIINLLMTPAMNARVPEVDRAQFVDAAMKEAAKSCHCDILKRQKPDEILEMHTMLGHVLGVLGRQEES